LARSVKGIQDALKGGDPDDAQAEKARTAAVMIAAYSQANLAGPDGQQRATVRDASLKVADLIKGKKYAEAAKQAAALPKLKEDPKAKKEKVQLMDKHITHPELMHQFRHTGDGGWGIFGNLQRIRTKQYDVLPREDVNEAFALSLFQVAVTADLLSEHAHKGRPKEWADYTGDMRRYASQLGTMIKDKDAKGSPPILGQLTTTCFNCHKMLKVKNTGN
jgi:hypothetical protein